MLNFNNYYRVEMQEYLTKAQFLESELYRLSTLIAKQDVLDDIKAKFDIQGKTHDEINSMIYRDHLTIVKEQLEACYDDIDRLNKAKVYTDKTK